MFLGTLRDATLGHRSHFTLHIRSHRNPDIGWDVTLKSREINHVSDLVLTPFLLVDLGDVRGRVYVVRPEVRYPVHAVRPRGRYPVYAVRPMGRYPVYAVRSRGLYAVRSRGRYPVHTVKSRGRYPVRSRGRYPLYAVRHRGTLSCVYCETKGTLSCET